MEVGGLLQIELFLELFPANVCLRCDPRMAEINAERENGRGKRKWLRKTKMVEENGRRMRDFALVVIFAALISVICGPQWRQKFTGNTFLKIAQSGHRCVSRIQCRCTLPVMAPWLNQSVFGARGQDNARAASRLGLVLNSRPGLVCLARYWRYYCWCCLLLSRIILLLNRLLWSWPQTNSGCQRSFHSLPARPASF